MMRFMGKPIWLRGTRYAFPPDRLVGRWLYRLTLKGRSQLRCTLKVVK
jgi:hypothetical protein